jgi:hypothetical protein
MNESRLGEDLKTIAERPPPNLPPDFNERVWAKIQHEERELEERKGVRENWLKTLLSAFATREWAAAAVAVALLVGWSLGRIKSGSTTSVGETRMVANVTGEVLDVACYFDDGGSGPDHAACARMCIASGLPVGIKTKEGKVYVLIGKQEPPSAQPAAKHETLNDQLAPYAGKIVTVNGTIVTKEGVNVIENVQLVGS